MTAFFASEQHDDGTEVLLPLDHARSGWGGPGPGQIRGTAVSGALARAAERTAGGLDGADRFRPARWTVDLFRPAAMSPVAVTSTVVRHGRRLRLVDTALVQGDRTVARGTALFLVTGETADGTVWTPPTPTVPSPPDPGAATEPTLYHSADAAWTAAATPHRNASRKTVWFAAAEVVAGETPSGFELAATVADAANMITNWGTAGIAFINADLTLALTRVPDPGQGLGLIAEGRVEQNGTAVGTATMFDAHGPAGTVMVSTVVQGGPAVDPGSFDADEVAGPVS